jgi:hypothetical protein
VADLNLDEARAPDHEVSLQWLGFSKPWNTADGDIDHTLKIFVFQGD